MASTRANGPSHWSLPDALAVQLGDVVSFVGGGGKTTAMFRLAEELSASGWRVVTTTSTHIGRGQSDLAEHHLWDPKPSRLIKSLEAALHSVRHVLVTGPPAEQGLKWGGVPAEWIGQVAKLPEVNAVLVEADGAKHLPFKAPADHEPVVPPATTLLVPMVGVDAVGRPVREVAHRPQQVCAIAGLGMGDLVTPSAIAAVLAHSMGGLKGRPPGARVRLLVNKVESPLAGGAAQEIAWEALSSRSWREAKGEAVILAALQSSQPVREVWRPIAPVVLAAGRAQRMGEGRLKQLLPWGDTSVLGRTVERVMGCPGLEPPVVVTGHRAAEVRQVLEGVRCKFVHNPDHATGQLSSLQAGVRSLADGVAGCLVVLADQPWLDRSVVAQVLAAHAAGPTGVVAPAYQGRRGHPVLIDRSLWSDLLGLEANLAPRHLLERYPDQVHLLPVDTESVLQDMDTWDAYQDALRREGTAGGER